MKRARLRRTRSTSSEGASTQLACDSGRLRLVCIRRHRRRWILSRGPVFWEEPRRFESGTPLTAVLFALSMTKEISLHSFLPPPGKLDIAKPSNVILRFSQAVLVSACVAFVVHGAEANAANTSNARVRQGAKIFHDRCANCHNKQPGDDSPFGPPNLYSAFRGKDTISRGQAETVIRDGRNAMPAFGNVLSKSEIASVIAYLQGRSPKP
jgi:mono/diheme cytochrome c family protein